MKHLKKVSDDTRWSAFRAPSLSKTELIARTKPGGNCIIGWDGYGWHFGAVRDTTASIMAPPSPPSPRHAPTAEKT